MLSLGEINQEMLSLSEWSLEQNAITRIFSFPNFKESIDFVNKVAEIAEKHNHHPDILINFDKVKLTLSTHMEHALTKKDFEVARDIDNL
jgi:4a-hydroxytetrahydrobiopterin dehydratase